MLSVIVEMIACIFVTLMDVSSLVGSLNVMHRNVTRYVPPQSRLSPWFTRRELSKGFVQSVLLNLMQFLLLNCFPNKACGEWFVRTLH